MICNVFEILSQVHRCNVGNLDQYLRSFNVFESCSNSLWWSRSMTRSPPVHIFTRQILAHTDLIGLS